MFNTRTSAGICLIIFGLFIFPTSAEDPKIPEGIALGDEISMSADSMSRVRGPQGLPVFVLEGNVKVASGKVIITGDKVWVDREKGDFEAEGAPARLVQTGTDQDFSWEGPKVSGNMHSRIFHFNRSLVTLKPFYLTARSVDRKTEGVVHLKGVKFSTCEEVKEDKFFTPWQFRASSLTYYEDSNWFSAWNVMPQIYGVPFFYLPWFGFDRDWSLVKIRQGETEDWGNWVTVEAGQFDLMPGGKWKMKPVFEHRQKRGEAYKMTHKFHSDENRLIGRAMVYYMNDRQPLRDTPARDATLSPGEEEFNAGHKTREADRYRMNWFSRFLVDDEIEFRAKLDLQSDNDMNFEFDRDSFYLDPEPSSYLDLSFLRDRFELSMNYQPKVNSFNSVLERLPEVRLDLPRQRIGSSMFYYQAQNSMAQLRMNFREYDKDGGYTHDYASQRADMAHTFYSPLSAGWLNILPRAGVRMTWYENSTEQAADKDKVDSMLGSDNRRGISAAPGAIYDGLGGERTRWVAEYGTEINFKAQADLIDLQSELLDIDGLRHTIIPYANYIYIPEPNEDKDHLYFFDGVDRIDKMDMVRLGLNQNLSTRRGFGPERQTVELFRMENFWDYYFNAESDATRNGDFGTIIEFTPKSWLRTDVKMLHDTSHGDLNVLNSGVQVGNDTLSIGADYLHRNKYTQRYNYSFGSDLRYVFGSTVYPLTFTENESITFNVNTKLGSKTRLMANWSYDLITNEVASQGISLNRDLGCIALGVGLRENNGIRGVDLAISLTAFPEDTSFKYPHDFPLGDE